MPRGIPDHIETFTAMTRGADGSVEFLAAMPLSDKPGFDANLVPFYTLSDRGSYFVPGAFKKTAKERRAAAPHLLQHDTWTPVGKHGYAAEHDDGFYIAVEVNEDIEAGRELMSNLRFGVPMGVSIGFDRIRDRSGSEDDDAKLDRSTAPDFLKTVPINELRAITEARWWESSSVTFPAIGTAKPTEVRSAGSDLESLSRLLSVLTEGTPTEADLLEVHKIVAAYEAYAARSTPDGADSAGTEDQARRDERRGQMAAFIATRARYLGIEGVTTP
jgi:HK97 family phage prohead protease